MSTLDFDAATHTYRLDGQVVPSVTGILKRIGLIDATWYSGDAFLLGQYAHRATALDDAGELDESTIDPRISGHVEAWRKFRRQTGFEPRDIEMPRVSGKYRYAGTIDRVGTIGGTEYIVDLKTGGPAAWHWLQLEGYAQLVGVDLTRVVVYLSGDGTYKAKSRTLSDRPAWNACLELYNYIEREANGGR